MRVFSLFTAAALGAVSSSIAGASATMAALETAEWQIGPIIRSRNYSVGMPLYPTAKAEGWFFEFPYPTAQAGHVHALTTRSESLSGKHRIVMRYRIETAPGVRIAPQEEPKSQATLSLFIQRRGDNWTAKGPYEHFRWYATAANRMPITPGEHELSLSLDPANWKSVASATGDRAPRAFHDTLANVDRLGFVFGGGGSAGHGVFATGPARFTLLSFRVL